MNEIRVSSWNELQERLFEETWQTRIERFRSRFAFRGLQDARYPLETSLVRLGRNYAHVEAHLLRNFRKYAHRSAAPGDSMWTWMAVAQHHGLPTRLLDCTYSPYVALHFATRDIAAYDVDAAIWCISYDRTNGFLPPRLEAILEEHRELVFTAEMLDCASGTLDEFERLSDSEFVVFFEPPSLDYRIVNQFALFCLVSRADMSLESWLRERPDACRRIVIPASLKWEIRDKLDQANITERVLFPGLDGLSRWLTRYYTPKEPDSVPEEEPLPRVRRIPG